MRLKLTFSFLILLALLSACAANASVTPAATETPAAAIETQAGTPVETESAATAAVEITAPVEPQATATIDPLDWRNLPVIPELSPAMLEVYQRGLASGRDPYRFSKIGDCQNVHGYFLGMFDGGTYSLGEEYAYLQDTINYFAGSWGRKSMAVKGALNIAAVQSPMWTAAVEQYTKQYDICKTGESPLVCELRDWNPSFALISMEESWDGSLSIYDENMRSVVEYVLSLDIVPILATRTELPDAERQINIMVMQIATDYDLPVWNFGAAAAKLPNAGLREGDSFHLSPSEETKYPHADFVDPVTLQFGWTWRNLTALQTLDAVRKSVLK